MSKGNDEANTGNTVMEEAEYDYTIEVEDKEFRVHKDLLVSVSDYFRAMLTAGMVESQIDRVRLHELSPECIASLVEFIYTGKLGTTEVGEEDLLSCAIYLQMPTAIEECTKLLVNKLNEQNCFEILASFQNYTLENGVKQTTMYVNSNIKEIMQICKPLKLSDDAFLNFSKFWKKAEWDHVDIVREWVHMNYKGRTKYINELMSCVRFGLLTPEQLEEIKQMDIYTDSDGEWHQLVDKAEEYHKLSTHQKVLIESEQCTVRQDAVPICYTATDTASNVLYSLYDGKSWKKHEAIGAPNLCKTKVCEHVTVNNFLIVCEDYDHSPTAVQRWHIFDARFLKWSTMASMQIPRENFALVHHGKHLYALGGRIAPEGSPDDSSLTDVIEQYDFETNTWSIIPSKLLDKLEKHSAFVIDEQIYVCGGIRRRRFCHQLNCLDLSTATWHRKALLPGMRGSAQPTNMMELDGEKILFTFGGCFDMNFFYPIYDLWYKWSDCLSDADSVISRESCPGVIVDKDNSLYLYGFLYDDEYKNNSGDLYFNGFARWRVEGPGKISEVLLDKYPIELGLYEESEWLSIATFLAIPPQF